MRDIIKASEQGSKIAGNRKALDLSLSETAALYENFKALEAESGKSDAIIKTIGAAYYAGLAVGSRNA